MATYSLDAIRKGLAEIIGVEGTEKVIDEALKAAGLPAKETYSQEEHSAICDRLKTKGGSIGIIVSLIRAQEAWQD